MKQFLIIILIVLTTQVLSSWSASAEQRADGQYYLVLDGPTAILDQICSYGDCQRGFNTRIAALNYWVSLQSQAFGIFIAPIPPPSG